jgi:NAD(P)-dependent dehydrogenase (short-subunit alcohol dehydrogenase family)
MVARGGGRVIDLNSGAGADDREIYSAYCAAKAGLFRIGGNLHLAGYERGIRSFELSPGVVRTDMTGAMAMHHNRSEWTAPETVTELVLAASRGELDAWSGSYLRAGIDTPQSLRDAAREGRARRPARTLGVRPWGHHDPI